MCFSGLKASPLFFLCGITLGSCPLSDPTVFMRKTTGGLCPPLFLPSAFPYPPVLSTFFFSHLLFCSSFPFLPPPLLLSVVFSSPPRVSFGSSLSSFCWSPVLLFYSSTISLPPSFLSSAPHTSNLFSSPPLHFHLPSGHLHSSFLLPFTLFSPFFSLSSSSHLTLSHIRHLSTFYSLFLSSSTLLLVTSLPSVFYTPLLLPHPFYCHPFAP